VRRIARLAVAAALATLHAGTGLAAEPGALGARLDAALAAPALRGAQVGALVALRGSGRTLYERRADQPLIPASNQKILTALAALATFGPAHRFTTRVASDAPPDSAGAVGTLYVRGGGDPALTSEDWWRLAADLRAAGLRRVRGDIALDDSLFDSERWHPEWGTVTERAYFGPVSALSANYGAFAIDVQPGAAPGAPARVSIDPPIAYLALANRATTGARRHGGGVAVEREVSQQGEAVLVSGSAPLGAEPTRIYRSVGDATLYAGAVLAWQLAAQGVEVGGRVRRGAAPAEAPELLAFEGRPLAEIVRLFMKHSNNTIAEGLVKSMGAADGGGPGSWPRGVAALVAQLRALGLGLDGVHIVDGSGLARSNRVTPRLLVGALLQADRSFAFGPEFEAALPIAATDGTLSHRERSLAGAVRAKTGSLDGVHSLSGYAVLGDGQEAVFSVIANGAAAGDAAVVSALDRFAAALVHGGAESAARAADLAQPEGRSQ
jgi:D-alanyl-D-alanine carboxypeptidase/D-alanyl-D-alanine-endopeptidase (penicillin-binding protein 4)